MDKNNTAKESYLKCGGIRCLNPECNSDDIEGGFIETDQGTASQKITCNNCGWTWRDVYTLTSVEDVEGK